MDGGLMTGSVVIGIDAGGTATRCVVATLDGHVLGRGTAGGASQRSSGGDPADALATAASAALSHAGLSQVDPSLVAGGIVGIAGAGAAGHANAQRSAEEAWRRAGAGGTPTVVGDLEVAFAAGTPAASGSLLLAGTGAVAAAFEDGRLARRCDGYGWLLGDEGSAVWLGLNALRAVLKALDGRGPETALTRPIAADLDTQADPQALLGAAYALPPAQLGRLAPIVCAAAVDGDPVARGVIDEGVERLLHSLEKARDSLEKARDSLEKARDSLEKARDSVEETRGAKAGGSTPVVVAGSLLLGDGPVRDGVWAGIRDRYSVEPSPARDGAAGAAALAIARLTGAPVTPDVHARLTGVPNAGNSSARNPSARNPSARNPSAHSLGYSR
jgi:N-acetylglucosamine kinase-like BadF-type ATPase